MGVLCDIKVPDKVKGKLYKIVVRPAMMRDSECWTINKKDEIWMEVAEMRILKWLCGVTRMDQIEENKLRWYGPVERRKSDKIVKKVREMVVEEVGVKVDHRKSWWRY